jgi:hypothetical protein
MSYLQYLIHNQCEHYLKVQLSEKNLYRNFIKNLSIDRSKYVSNLAQQYFGSKVQNLLYGLPSNNELQEYKRYFMIDQQIARHFVH